MCQMLIITRTHKSVKPTKERLSLRTRESLLWTTALTSFLEGSLRRLFPPGPSATRAVFPEQPCLYQTLHKIFGWLRSSLTHSHSLLCSCALVFLPQCHAVPLPDCLSPCNTSDTFFDTFFLKKTCYLSGRISYFPALCSSSITL